MASSDAQVEGWADQLATSVAARSSLAPAVAAAVRRTFAEHATELSFVLASGEAGQLEQYSLLSLGQVTSGPLRPEPLAAPGAPTAAQEAISSGRVLLVDRQAPNRDEFADWRQLHAGGDGVDWLLAAPLVAGCLGASSRLLGAVLVGGKGAQPGIDSQWLQGWAGEMAVLIRHASVQLMETSLEVLGCVFPPRVLEQLVANAAKKTGQVDLAEAVLTSLPPSPHPGGSLSPGTAPGSARSSLEESAQQAGQAQQGGGRPPLGQSPRSFSPLKSVAVGPPGAAWAQQQPRASLPGTPGGDAAGVSPFAAQAAMAAAAAAEFSAAASLSPGSRRGGIAASPAPSGSLTPTAAALLTQASRGGSMASALLREVSLQSSLGCLQDTPADVPLSPLSAAEVSGFEDLLADDHRMSLERRPSMAPERARSHPSPALDQCIAAATAAMEEAAGSGLSGAVRSAQAHSAEQAAAAAAAAAGAGRPAAADPATPAPAQRARSVPLPPPAGLPAVHVPWQKKPIINPLGSDKAADDEAPLLSPPPKASASSAASGASSAGSFAGWARGASTGAPGDAPADPSAAPAAHPAGKGSGEVGKAAAAAGAASGGTLSGSMGSAVSGASASSAGSTALSLEAARQGWDLSFAAPALEASFRRWLAPYLARSDRSLGLVHWLVLATGGVKMMLGGAAAAAGVGALLSLAGLLVMAACSLPAWLLPAWWAAHRTPALAAGRALISLLFAVQCVLLARTQDAGPCTAPAGAGTCAVGEPGRWDGSVIVSSGAAALAFLPLRFPLPFSLHLPLHLLCLWVMTAGASVGHVVSHGATSAPAAILAQLLVGFLLASLLACHREQRLRAGFLKTRHAATCLAPRGKDAPAATPAGQSQAAVPS